MRLFSYVVDHDNGISPNPAGGMCTLVHCKFNRSGLRKNIVESVDVGDWILGSGGTSHESAGAGTIIYLMQVSQKISFREYMTDRIYSRRLDRFDNGSKNQYALISKTYFYFGKDAIPIESLPLKLREAALLKAGRGYRKDLPAALIQQLVEWFIANHSGRPSGPPCAPHHKVQIASGAAPRRMTCRSRRTSTHRACVQRAC